MEPGVPQQFRDKILRAEIIIIYTIIENTSQKELGSREESEVANSLLFSQ